MTVAIHPSAKFHHSNEQYYAVAGGQTLLRLTYGSFNGVPGGAIKTATTNDYGAEQVYPDQHKLTTAMRLAVQKLGGRAEDVRIEIDKKGRRFGEITGRGTREELIEVIRQLAEEMEPILRRPSESTHHCECRDMRAIHHELCGLDGEPVYLSDGMYLDSDGRIFE